jgi:hypothetical protein
MSNIYCISGLGADYRLFQNLAVPGYTIVPLPWLPIDPADTLPSFAMKMAKQIPEANPIILGLSFGGMLATEIGKQVQASKIFLISSAKTNAELGYRSALLQWISKKELIPASMFNRPFSLLLHMLGADTAADKAFLSRIISEANTTFVRRAIHLILHWKNDSYPPIITHIHGTKDLIISPRHIKADYWIEGGSHIMIYNRAAEVSKIISDNLAAAQ